MPYPNQENPYRPERYRDAEAQLGGADDVEKTTYVRGSGTTPEQQKPTGPIATVPSRGEPTLAWALIALAVMAALAYLIGIVR